MITNTNSQQNKYVNYQVKSFRERQESKWLTCSFPIWSRHSELPVFTGFRRSISSCNNYHRIAIMSWTLIDSTGMIKSDMVHAGAIANELHAFIPKNPNLGLVIFIFIESSNQEYCFWNRGNLDRTEVLPTNTDSFIIIQAAGQTLGRQWDLAPADGHLQLSA